jgi:DNA invertase Pin-like site-specific DNA recombinase
MEEIMKIGYARVSSMDQHEDRQIAAMLEAGVELSNIYLDKQSGKDFNREAYKNMVKALRQGDTLVIKSIDRFGRDYEQIRKEFAAITDKGVAINVLDMPALNTDQVIAAGLTGKFISDIILSILGYVAEQERLNIKTRQAEGIKTAKAKGVQFGRPTKEIQAQKVAALLATDDSMTVEAACKVYGISRRAYYNYK